MHAPFWASCSAVSKSRIRDSHLRRMIAALAMLSLGKLPMPARPAGGAARARSARAAGRAASTATWAAASVCLPEAAAGGVAAAAAAAGACPLAVTGPQVALAASHILPAGGLFSPGATHRPHQAAAASQAEGVAPALRQLQSELQLADQAHLQVRGAFIYLCGWRRQGRGEVVYKNPFRARAALP